MDEDTIQRRLSAVERAVDGDAPAPERADEDRESLAARIETLEADVAELEAGLQAVRGYVGNVRSVNEDVERRADAALAKAKSAAAAATADDHRHATPSRREPSEPANSPEAQPEPTDEGSAQGLLAALRERL
jgi:chromosome segregation ATPase